MMENSIDKFILYNAPTGEVRVDVYLEGETVWLTQKAMSSLFGVESHTITYQYIKAVNYNKTQLL